jgi:hypothetical protein
MKPQDFKLGTWIYRVRNYDRNVIQIRAVEAVLELMKELPANKYPSRLDIALSLAAGEVLSTRQYTYALHLNGVVGFEDSADQTSQSA